METKLIKFDKRIESDEKWLELYNCLMRWVNCSHIFAKEDSFGRGALFMVVIVSWRHNQSPSPKVSRFFFLSICCTTIQLSNNEFLTKQVR